MTMNSTYIAMAKVAIKSGMRVHEDGRRSEQGRVVDIAGSFSQKNSILQKYRSGNEK